jgi:putative ABC transport system ATP-binding protein
MNSVCHSGLTAGRDLHSDQAREIMELFRELDRAGTTIVQVTHSENKARYGNRVIRLCDGWLVT